MCDKLPSLNALLGIPEPTRADQIHSAKIRIEEIEGDLQNLLDESDRLKQEVLEYTWSLTWRIKAAKLTDALHGAEVALTNVLRVLEDDYAKINCPVVRGKIISSTEEIDAILEIIQQLNLPK